MPQQMGVDMFVYFGLFIYSCHDLSDAIVSKLAIPVAGNEKVAAVTHQPLPILIVCEEYFIKSFAEGYYPILVSLPLINS